MRRMTWVTVPSRQAGTSGPGGRLKPGNWGRPDDAALLLHLVLGPVIIHDRHGAEFSDSTMERAATPSRTCRKRNPAVAIVVASTEGELFRVPFVEAPGVLPVK